MSFGTGPSCLLITPQARAHFKLMQPAPSCVLVENYSENELCEHDVALNLYSSLIIYIVMFTWF